MLFWWLLLFIKPLHIVFNLKLTTLCKHPHFTNKETKRMENAQCHTVNWGSQIRFRSSCSKSRATGVWIIDSPDINLHCLCGKAILDNQRPRGTNSSHNNNNPNLLGDFFLTCKVLSSSSYSMSSNPHHKAAELWSSILQATKPWLSEVKEFAQGRIAS